MGQAKLEVRNLSVAYERDASDTPVFVLKEVSFCLDQGEFMVAIGPSGCGKTTLLNAVAGFIRPWNGEILVGSSRVTSPGPDRGVVFQHAALFSWLTVGRNIEYGLRIMKVPKEERQKRVAELLHLVRLEGTAHKYPRELSGGMQQRVGLARALAIDPEVLLMDEPFGALDAQTRQRMQELLAEIWSSRRKTVLFITHDLQEALLLADRILVIKPVSKCGRITKEVRVNLPRPRKRNSSAFIAQLEELDKFLREEVED